MTVQTRSTKAPFNGSLSLATKHKQPIYISATDKRNNPAYLKSHPGQIIVLSEQDYALWLRQEYISTSSDGVSVLLNDNETTDLYGTIDQTISAPGIPIWNTSDISYVSTDTGIFQNIVISFGTSANDPLDGSYTYHVHYTPVAGTAPNTTGTGSTPSPTSGSGGSSGSASPGSTVLAPVGAKTTVSNTSTLISVSWGAVTNAVSYTVTVSGNGVPYASPTGGGTSFVVPSAGGPSLIPYAIGALSSGIYTFSLAPISPAVFSGGHTLSVQVNYGSVGSSSAVTYAL